MTTQRQPISGAVSAMLTLAFAFAFLFWLVLSAFGQEARPVPRIGSCPTGYRISGGYCVPMPSEHRDAMPRIGQCPSGYYQSGFSYCKNMRAR